MPVLSSAVQRQISEVVRLSKSCFGASVVHWTRCGAPLEAPAPEPPLDAPPPPLALLPPSAAEAPLPLAPPPLCPPLPLCGSQVTSARSASHTPALMLQLGLPLFGSAGQSSSFVHAMLQARCFGLHTPLAHSPSPAQHSAKALLFSVDELPPAALMLPVPPPPFFASVESPEQPTAPVTSPTTNTPNTAHMEPP